MGGPGRLLGAGIWWIGGPLRTAALKAGAGQVSVVLAIRFVAGPTLDFKHKRA